MANNYGGWDPENPKTPPPYQPPSQGLMGLLQQLVTQAQGGPSQQWNQAWGMGQQAAGMPGGAQTIQQYLPMLGQYVGKGGNVADAYERSAMRGARQETKTGLQDLARQMGAQGSIGSTIHGVSGADILQRGAQNVANIKAQSAQMGEQIKQSRMGLGMQGLGQLGQQASYDQMNAGNLAGTMLGAAQSQQNAGMQGLLQALQTQYGIEQAPNQYGMNIWSTLMGMPPKPSGVDMLLGGLGTLLPLLG